VTVHASGISPAGKTLAARAVANRTDATFIRVIGSELVQRYVGEGARLVREIFKLAKTKQAAIIFFDEIDAGALVVQECSGGWESNKQGKGVPGAVALLTGPLCLVPPALPCSGRHAD